MPDAKIMDGRALAAELLSRAKRLIGAVRECAGHPPSLTTMIVGDDPASHIYVRMKQRRCDETGVAARTIELPATVDSERVVAEVRRLGEMPAVDAILVQHPSPSPIDRRAVFEAIPLEKDVDGVSSAALGRVIAGLPGPAPCTPAGIMALLRAYEVDLDGAHAVVIGRSPILGRPLASMLINAHATVTLCHSRTRGLREITRQADVLIAAAGRPRMVTDDWIKPGAVVIDAGYSADGAGDVDFEAVRAAAALVTPVPGGVGPVTIATLVLQTAQIAAAHVGLQESAPQP
jgi:methylenetetrahydrofolate dehydrogenase (NADP+)/methenyltetrahydrofolate cyclohydrolase